LLKRTGATLSTIALGVACSDPDEPTKPDDGTPANAGSGSGPQSSAGSGGPGPSNSGNAGAGQMAASGRGGTAGSRGNAGSTGTSGSPASGGSSGQPEEQAGESGGGTAGAGDSGKVRVAIVHRTDVDEAVARAVEMAGGIDEIQAGQSVFIKINAVNNRAIGSTGIRTSNEVMAAVVKLVKQRNPGKIIVGDHAARGFDTVTVFDEAGINEAAMNAGADEVYAAPRPDQDPDAWMLVKPDGYEVTWQAAGGISVLRKIVESDHLISVPVCKNHRYALFSLSMKLFIGAIADASRDPIHYGETIASDFGPIGRDIAVINKAFNPLISIIDATTAIINGGPQGDGADTVRVQPGLILASRNRLALDALAVSMIKFELGRTTVSMPDASHSSLMTMRPWDLPQIKEGIMRGLGISGAADADLMFDDVADASAIEAIFRA
jgi:uncharacterized protein (DUF362 family)